MIDYSELTAEELAEAYAAIVIEKRELAEREYQIKRELADKLVDREPDETGLYRFNVGAFKLRKAGVKETWDKDAVARATYRRAVEGTDYVDALGELMMTPEQRVFDTMQKVFSLTPRKTPLKAMGFDLDEYVTKEGEGELTIQMMEA